MPNTSNPMPVVRIGGGGFDIDAALAAVKIAPYRIDRAGSGRAKENALYFHISDSDVTTRNLSATIKDFLTANEGDLRQLRKRPGVEYFELDIGVVIDDGTLSRSTTIGPEALAALAALNIACIISAYRGGEK